MRCSLWSALQQPRRGGLERGDGARCRDAARARAPTPRRPPRRAAAAPRGRPARGCRRSSPTPPRPARWLRAESGTRSPGGASVISHGYTLTATGPSPGASAMTSPPPSSATTVSPSGPGARSPVSTTAPVKSATKADAGSAASADAVPSWTTRPRVHHRDAVAEQRGLGEVVRDEQDRHARFAEHGRQLARRGRARAGVERGQRLVEQQRLRPPRQRAGDGDALALAARQRGRAARRRARRAPKRSSSARARGSRSPRGASRSA